MTSRTALISIQKLILFIFLIVVANLILAIMLIQPIILPGKQIPATISSILVMIIFFIYYILFGLFLTHYFRIFKSKYKGNEHKYLIGLGSIGFIGITIFSFWKLGTAPTFQWLIPSAMIIFIPLVQYYMKKNKGNRLVYRG